MLRSLLTKAVMLAATAGVVVWIGWPVPQEPAEHSPLGVAGGFSEAALPERAPDQTGLDRTTAPSPHRASESGRKAAPTLDLNRATLEELQALPGIGEVLARRIADRRSAYGPFRSVEELQEIKGIGGNRLNQLRPLLTVAQAPHVSRAGGPKPMKPMPGAERH